MDYPLYASEARTRRSAVVATAAVRREFHGDLGSSYAPGIIASFGSGTSQVDVRVIAPGG
jgi:hypothetical protein